MREIPTLRTEDNVMAEGIFTWRCPRALGFLWLSYEGFSTQEENWTLESFFGPKVFGATYSFTGGGGQWAQIHFARHRDTEASLILNDEEFVLDFGGVGMALRRNEKQELLSIKPARRDSERAEGIVHRLLLQEGVPSVLAGLTYGAVLVSMTDAERLDF